MPFTTLAAIAAAVVLTVLAAFQLLLVAGAPPGHVAWGGRAGVGVLPARLRVASGAAVPVLGLAAWTVLARAGAVDAGCAELLVKGLTWMFAVLFALNTLGNLASRSDLERRVMTPATFMLVLCFIAVALA
jgi:hypothetical protein